MSHKQTRSFLEAVCSSQVERSLRTYCNETSSGLDEPANARAFRLVGKQRHSSSWTLSSTYVAEPIASLVVDLRAFRVHRARHCDCTGALFRRPADGSSLDDMLEQLDLCSQLLGSGNGDDDEIAVA
jgi:hypothetical protein